MPATRHFCCFFFFNDTATTEIYTLSLHDALPIYRGDCLSMLGIAREVAALTGSRLRRRRSRLSEAGTPAAGDRKSTRLNSSHLVISYAVFCLKKKKTRLCGPAARRAAPSHGAQSA